VTKPLLAFLIAWGSIATRPASAQDVHDHVNMGIAAVEAHDLPTGLAHFEAALALDSTSYEANWRTAVALMDAGELAGNSRNNARRDSLYASAEALAYRAVRADSSRAEGHFVLAAAIGRASLTMGKKDRIRRAAVIRDEALRCLAIDPRYDGAYHILGRWNAEIMRLSGLSRFFAKKFLGAGVFGKASWEAATSNMERAVQLDPGRIYHRLELAEIYADRKRYPEAKRELDELAALPDREILDSVYRIQAAELSKKLARRT
jgi:tetratricopeptide (TPR) repeat protein